MAGCVLWALSAIFSHGARCSNSTDAACTQVKHGASPGKRAAAEDDQEGHVHKKARHSASKAQQQGKKHKPGLSTAHGKPAQAHSQPAAAGAGKVQHSKPSFAAGGKLLQPVKAKHAFKVDDPRDHAETPFEAYRDVEPLLFRLAQQLGTPKESLRIYVSRALVSGQA